MRHSLLAATLLAVTCASAALAEPVRPGEEQGLGLTGPQVPQLLKDARANPYALPAAPDCPRLAEQIADLDQVLGPDVDAPQVKASNSPDLMAGVRAILPYGGVVRMFTRAGHQEKALTNAALAGWERRGFLKGTARMMGCPVFGQAAYPAPIPREPAPR